MSSLRIPQLIARFLPFSVLLGTLITLATLNQNSEIVAMKAAGISAHQIIAPLIVASLGSSPRLAFVFQERSSPARRRRSRAWEASITARSRAESGTSDNVWVRHGDDLIFAASSAAGASTRLQGVTIYDRSGGTLGDDRPPKSGARRRRLAAGRRERSTSPTTTLTPKPPRRCGRRRRRSHPVHARQVDPDEQDFTTLQGFDRRRWRRRPPTGRWRPGSGTRFRGRCRPC
jgi:hypothetical protein